MEEKLIERTLLKDLGNKKKGETIKEYESTMEGLATNGYVPSDNTKTKEPNEPNEPNDSKDSSSLLGKVLGSKGK